MRRRVRVADLDIRRFNGQLAARGHGVPGVHDQVHEHLLQLAGIGAHGVQSRGQHRAHLDRLADQAPHDLVRGHHHLVEVEHPRRQHLLAGERQELSRQVRRPHRGLGDFLRFLPGRVADRQAVERELGKAHDGGEQVVEVVGDPGGQ